MPQGVACLTMVDITGLHFSRIQYCHCPETEAAHLQLLRVNMFPASIQNPCTTFTFRVLDDFLRDNVECGMAAMNYFSKLRQITSNIFPHLVPDQYREFMGAARIWRLLKLLKWSGMGDPSPAEHSQPTTSHWPDRMPRRGDLVLFCPACPQPGINLSAAEEGDLSHWKYTQTVVMDGNFKAKHMHDHQPDDQVCLMDGRGYMRSKCNNHWAVNQANANQHKLEATGIRGCACAHHGCFVPHAVINFQKGEQQVNMDYALTHALSYNMTRVQ
ncbi:hypothetical protein BDN67DRAFT_992862 [Paxillus ammoniavirescens]|nr:hypothetical protein BDN67DRAFT_992862 [Paxillus ammoniavirescens]